jgi:hypothetical protein
MMGSLPEYTESITTFAGLEKKDSAREYQNRPWPAQPDAQAGKNQRLPKST